MYAAIRPALRASTRSPARLIRGRRYPSPHRTRTFHATSRLAQDPTPPAGEKSTSTDSNGVDKKDKKDKQGGQSAAAPTEAGVAPEDAEDLAQKLQRSRELTRRYSSALRRTQRRNRAQDLPPVVVPDWFLKSNVFCLEEVRDKAATPGQRHAVTLSLQRRDSEETTTCTVPLSRPSAGVELLTELLRTAWRTHLDAEQKRRFARQLASTLDAADNERVVQLLEHGQDPNADIEKVLDRIAESSDSVHNLVAAMKSSKNEAFSQTIADLQESSYDMDKSIEEQREALANTPSVSEVPPYVLAEIQATIAASLSALQPASTNTFASTKTNLTLHCPSTGEDSLMAKTIISTASELGAEVVVLHAQDLAEIGGDYLSEGSEPTPHSIRSLGYETYRGSPPSLFDLGNIADYFGTPAEDQDDAQGPLDLGRQDLQDPGPLDSRPEPGPERMPIPPRGLYTIVMSRLSAAAGKRNPGNSAVEPQARVQTQAETQVEDLKLANLLDSLLDSPNTKRLHGLVRSKGGSRNATDAGTKSLITPPPAFFNASTPPVGDRIDLTSALPYRADPKFNLAVHVEAYTNKPLRTPKPKIIFIDDFKELNATQYGGRVVDKLEEIVRKRRSAGESIMIVGSTCSEDLTPELSKKGVQNLQSGDEADSFRTIVVPIEDPLMAKDADIIPKAETSRKPSFSAKRKPRNILDKEERKNRAINLRHIQDMLRCLDPVASRHTSDRELSLEDMRTSASIFPSANSSKVLTYDEVHRIALTALGLHLLEANPGHLKWTHVTLAMTLLKVSDEVKFAYARSKTAEKPIYSVINGEMKRNVAAERRRDEFYGKRNEFTAGQSEDPDTASRRIRDQQMAHIARTANQYEKRLMPGIANPEQIKTTFDQVHVAPETIDSIRTLTSMSFLRPDAFSYGVLATEKISGALLYGPPGTGKTMLAKAVAKESGCAVLEVSGSSIMDKYVGEGEKNVTAVFSLARKMSPCIVFLDEADAIFSSRDAGRERSSHRDILNQFLKEWDGLNDLSVFVMVATNRPFDLDDAVIRRLPRRLLVDLPTQVDRHAILKIHLQDERLDSSVDLEDIAKKTPFYSGSDLKNLAVSAALACVKEENEQAAIAAAAELAGAASEDSPAPPTDGRPPQLSRGHKYEFPETRVLYARHFDKALQEISASISEDMGSLGAIKKFDEKYGDKKGKKKKRVFGIGLNTDTNESAARVRP
jgi:SpoVK/Ycf46/Vps4 family AAA+-type ATPase